MTEDPLRFKVQHCLDRYSRRFGLKQKVYRVSLPSQPRHMDAVFKALEDVITDITKGYHPDDVIRLNIYNEACLRRFYFIPFMKVRDLSANHVLKQLDSLLQSGEDFLLTGPLVIDFLAVPLSRESTL